jgi:predicted GIY-YIG superfamily endonuclease
VYCLRLESGKFYVGKSTDIDERLKSHSAKWTQEYDPISVDDVFPANTELKALEREVTLMYMSKYGWQNVRGAGWTSVNMKGPPKDLDKCEA